jgi:NTP pyrophosphatase (non-canonical NTP hydrolase)
MDETCPVCGRVDSAAYQCWRVGHLTPNPVLPEISMFNKFSNYDAEVKRTAADLSEASLPILALGIAGEAGEVADIVKKVAGHGHTLDRDKLLSEIGDCLWYCSALCQALGFRLEDAAYQNSVKLRKRYPLGFSTEASLKRVDTEQK